jgi:CrcB protein
MPDAEEDTQGPTPPDGGSGGTPPPGDHHRFHDLARAVGADDQLPIDPDLEPDDVGGPSRTHRAGTAHERRARPAVLASILAGGFLGTLARYEVSLAWPTSNGHFPTATFVINTSGAFLLGLLLAILLERRHPTRYLRPFAATGVLGGWTTYSSLVVEATTLGKSGDVALAGGYLALTLVCGVIAVTLGIALGRSRMSTPGPEPEMAAAHTWEAGR